MYYIKVKDIKKLVTKIKILRPTLVNTLKILLDSAHSEGEGVEVFICLTGKHLGQFDDLRELYNVLRKHNWGSLKVIECYLEENRLVLRCK